MKTGSRPAGRGPAGGSAGCGRGRALGDPVDLGFETGELVEVEQVPPRGLRRDQHRCSLPNTAPQHRTHVGTLLPGDLLWSLPEGEVVDEDRRRRRVSMAKRRARPVRIENGVALEVGFHLRQPAGFQGQLVAVGREYGITVETPQV